MAPDHSNYHYDMNRHHYLLYLTYYRVIKTEKNLFSRQKTQKIVFLNTNIIRNTVTLVTSVGFSDIDRSPSPEIAEVRGGAFRFVIFIRLDYFFCLCSAGSPLY
jgi:hypothetical protein